MKTIILFRKFQNNFGTTNLFEPKKIGDMELNHCAVVLPLTRLKAESGHMPYSKLAIEFCD